MGFGATPWKILILDPMLGWADPPIVLCMIFSHVFLDAMVFLVHGIRRDAFRSMVMDALASINIYCNIERNIIKNQTDSPSLGSRGNLCVYVFYVLCSCIVYFLCFRILMQVIFVQG